MKYQIHDTTGRLRCETDDSAIAAEATACWSLTDAEWLTEVKRLDPLVWLTLGGSIAEPPFPLYYLWLHEPAGTRGMSPTKLVKDFRAALDYAAHLLAEKQFLPYLLFAGRPSRVELFANKVADKVTDAEFWQLFAWVYTDSDNQNQNKAVWRKLFKSRRADKEHFMTTEEQEFFNALPHEITVYRGYHPAVANLHGFGRYASNKKGRSWSLSYEIALGFTARVHGHGMGNPNSKFVRTMVVNKHEALGYLNSRAEQEIVFTEAR